MEANEKQKIVFLTDESIEYRNTLRKCFREAGINARIFSFDCEDKLMHYLTNLSIRPDIIFLSFDIESDKAKECLKNMKRDKKLADIPVVIFSACTYLADINEAFNSGANLFIPKPVFLQHRTKVLRTLFLPPCQRALKRPNKKKFVLASATNDELMWTAS
jgi:response regulator RpfG family c-di-GMP phosphodiesterase